VCGLIFSKLIFNYFQNFFEYVIWVFSKTENRFGSRRYIFFSTSRGVTRLDGAQGKKQILHPIFEPEVLGKQMHSIEESSCDIVGIFRPPPQSSGAPRSDSASGVLCPPLPPGFAPVR